METCRGRFREELKNARGRRRQESDTISQRTERGIVLALACLIYKHYINITLLSFAPQEAFFQWRGLTRGKNLTRVKIRVERGEQMLKGTERGVVNEQKQVLVEK